jgi:hypothetical protein
MKEKTMLKTTWDRNLTEKIDRILRDAQKIKPGMSRADLLTVFTEEGGVSSRNQRRYVHKKCPYIKINVEFQPVGRPERNGESPADRIVQISQAFLEWSIMD